MTYSRRVMIHAQGAYAVVSWGNGEAYDFHYGGQSVFLQGDDATTFRKALARAYESANDPAGLIARKGALAWLWDECGYGESAQ